MPNPLSGLWHHRRSSVPGRAEHEEEAVFETLIASEGSASPSLALPASCLKQVKGMSVAVVGGGLGGLMAARVLGQHGVKVTVFEARAEVGGRVLSDTTFSKGRITEAGAELIGTFHKRWKRLAIEYGLTLISRMDYELYRRAGLNLQLTLDKALSMNEIKTLADDIEQRVLIPMSRMASQITDPSRPWLNSTLRQYDQMSVARALETIFHIDKTRKTDLRLWLGLEMLLVNDNGGPLDQMNFLGLLCLVKGGQINANDDPPMGYWIDLELFRCADGCQMLALKMANEIKKKYGKLLRQTEVTHIDLSKRGAAISWRLVTRNGTPVERQVPGTGRFDYVVLAIPPSVWSGVTITPEHPKNSVGVMGMGTAFKYISDVKRRFWIEGGAAPVGGSLPLGQVWEGTDNQTRSGPQGILLNVFGGGRIPIKNQFEPELQKLYPGYGQNKNKTLFANWSAEKFIMAGCTAPALGQIFTVGNKLNEPFLDRMVFAGDHTRMDLFGYMEGALASGEQAARTLLEQACGIWKKTALPSASEPLRVAEIELNQREVVPTIQALEDEVLGTDDRVLVADTLAVPNRWICAIDIFIANPQWPRTGPKLILKSRATGILVGPRHVLTAAHILDKQEIEIDGEQHKVDVKGFAVSPARNGNNRDNPVGKVASKAVKVATPYQIIESRVIDGKPHDIPIRRRDDYALIILEKDLDMLTHPKMVGSLGYWGQTPDKAVVRRLDAAAIKGREIIVTGYPGDRCGKAKLNGDTLDKKQAKIEYCFQRSADIWASTQWAGRGVATEAQPLSTDLFHSADTYEGQSGAPICLRADGKLCLIGIHTGASSSNNKGVRVTRRMLKEICSWMNADAGRVIATIEDDALVVRP